MSGVVPDVRTAVPLLSVAVLTGRDDERLLLSLPVPFEVGLPVARSDVVLGRVEVPVGVMGSKLDGRELKVRCHSGPPATISEPP